MAKKTNKSDGPELSTYSLPVTQEIRQAVIHQDKDKEQEIEYIKLADIFASPTNPRRHVDDGPLAELGESIRKFGVIQPITLRAKKGMSGKYELVCGERRWLASKLVERLSIPAIIRDLSDDEVLDLQFTENLQRQDVHPMDEAVTFKAMIATNRYTMADIAAKVLKSEAFVAQRISLNSLIPEFQKDFWENKFLIGHAILFSRLPVKDQKELHKQYGGRENYDTLAQTKDYIDRNVIRKLSAAPFKRDDAELVPKAGPCTTCLKRSGCNTSLFADYDKDDRCFDQACFEQKMSAFLLQKVKSTIETKPEVLLVDAGHYRYKVDPAVKKLASDMKVEIVESNFNTVSSFQSSDAVPVKVLMVSGSDAGKIKTMYAKSKKAKAAAAGGKTPKRTAEDVQAEIDGLKNRQARAVELDGEKVWERIKKLLDQPAMLTKVKFASIATTQDERNAMAIALIDSLDKDLDFEEAAFEVLGLKDVSDIWDLEVKHLTKLKVTEGQLFHLLRLIMIGNLQDGESHLDQIKPAALTKVLRDPSYLKDDIEIIEEEQGQVAAKRIASADKRLAALKAEKKALEGEPGTKASKKAAPKKAAKQAEPVEDEDDLDLLQEDDE
jgi:ParB/RepB/Spo0J family partition protein